MAKLNDSMWTAVATGATVLAAVATRSAITSAWRRATDEDPPRNPAAGDTDWSEALVWAVATSLAVGLARLLALRGATAAWHSVAGDEPPGL